MDSRIYKKRIQRRLYHVCASDCDSDSEMDGLSTSSLPLTEACMEYFQDSFPGSEGLGRLDMPMAATVTKRNQVSPASVVLSMMYAKRLRQRNKQYLQSMSSTDVFFISMMMASKYLYDEGVDEEVYNDEWAASVGHETDEVNRMEMDFLKEMDWHLFTKHEDFGDALTAVERRLALKEGVKRGWFTYTEMAVLLDWDPVCNLWNQVGMDCTKMVSLLSAVYVASLVSMMGSAALAFQLSVPVATATVEAVLSLYVSTMSTTSHTLNLLPFTVMSPQTSVDTMVVCADEAKGAGTPEALLSLSSMHNRMEENPVVRSCLEQNHTDFQSEDIRVGRTDSAGAKDDDDDDGDNHDKDSGLEDGTTFSKQKLKSATSVFSMWLFDSLISQVWSVLGATSSGCDENLQRCEKQIGESDQGLESKVVSGKLCDGLGCVEAKRRKGKGDRSAKQSRTSQSSTHVSIDKDAVDTSRVEEMNDCCLGCIGGYATTSTTNCSIGSCKCPNHQPNTLTSDSCLCNSLDCRCRLDPLVQLDIVGEVPDTLSGHSNNHPSSLFPSPPSQDTIYQNNLDLTLPLSLTEVPVLDPLGFFTKNSSPASYVLST